MTDKKTYKNLRGYWDEELTIPVTEENTKQPSQKEWLKAYNESHKNSKKDEL